jgi:curved DNA-binding protein CbpA
MSPDPYHVLGLTPGASQAEVKRAYRTLAKAHHPDSAGESALPRFLAIQAAYEHLLDPRRHAAAAARARATGRQGEPWRADPSRAREARSSAGMGSADSMPGGGSAGTRRSSSARSRPPGSGGDRGGAGTRSGSGRGASEGTTPGGGPKPGGTRRRAARKATPGSTSYDEARDPTDTTWDGAAWYGQSSGEYWRVNPREYADPRKHGPEYQARAVGARPRSDAPRREVPRAEAARADRPAAGASRPREAPHRAPDVDAPADASAGARALDLASILPFRLDPAILDRLVRRRAVAALAAWPPIGIAAAALIGEVTGCATFAVTCTASAPLYPWIAQGLILAALLVAPGVARLLAGGTAAVIVLALPVTAALSASGAGYDRTYGPASLIGILALAWLGGVGLAVARRARAHVSPNPGIGRRGDHS